MDRKVYLNIWTWLVIVGVAIALRLLFIQYDVWYDEACSWFTAIQTFPKGIINNLLSLDLQHTPLYFFLLHFWIKIFGDSEVAMRSLSILFGIATVPMAYVVARKITSSLNAKSIAAVLAVAPLLVFFSVEIRMYPIAVFLILLSLNYLIDFEQKGEKKSLVKLVIANLLIPYTLVGAIFYNLSLIICYSIYLFKSNKDKFVSYIKSAGIELLCLVPYFVLIGYYAKMRSVFVVRHEGEFYFSHFVDLIRNFFGIDPVINVYWPASEPYNLTFIFCLLVVVPCVYFIYGYIQGFKASKSFERVLYVLFTLILLEFVMTSAFGISVFTTRYILYVLPPLFILSIHGLSGKISQIHLKTFIILFFIGAFCTNINYSMKVPAYRTQAFKAVKLVSDEYKLDKRDIVIMPFGSDAPYYFRKENSPRVLAFDFHKEARNPYNPNFYDKEQIEKILAGKKGQVVYDSVFSNSGFSNAHFEYFVNNVNASVEKDRYVLIALYSTDANALVSIEDLRRAITSVQDVEDNCLDILLKKYLFDIRAYLEYDFYLEKAWSKDAYTYILLRRK